MRDFAVGIALATCDAVLSRKRAVRYELRVPVLYRAAGQQRWSEGVTTDVSPSGVLIVGDLPDECAQPIAVVIKLPRSSGCLTGCGRIARVSGVDSPDGRRAFAISVPKFSIERDSAALARLDTLHQGC
jgi:hypothetical protein